MELTGIVYATVDGDTIRESKITLNELLVFLFLNTFSGNFAIENT